MALFKIKPWYRINKKELSYYDTVTPSTVLANASTVTIGNYALFGGGINNNGIYGRNVCAYNKDLVKSNLTELSQYPAINTYSDSGAASTGDYALFSPGQSTSQNVISVYDKSLTKINTTLALSIARMVLCRSVGNYVVCGGGYRSNTTIVDAFDNSLTRVIPAELSTGFQEHAYVASMNDYIVFGGGVSSTANFRTVNVYDKTLTRIIPTELTSGIEDARGAGTNNCVLFGGGYKYNPSPSGYTTIVQGYDKSLTKINPTELGLTLSYHAAVSISDYILFGGGCLPDSDFLPLKAVYVYDKDLTRTALADLSVARYWLSAVRVSKYILFGCGQIARSGTRWYSVTDAYKYA